MVLSFLFLKEKKEQKKEKKRNNHLRPTKSASSPGDGQADRPFAAIAVVHGDDVHLDAIDGLQPLRRDDLAGRAEASDGAVLHQQRKAADGERVFRAVRGHDDAIALRGEAGDHLHEQLMVGVIQVGRRLVHDEHLGRLADGAGDQDQLALAEKFRLTRIPTPGGGCRLTEKENARRYWPVLRDMPHPVAADFHLANLGRQFWLERHGRRFWLSMGRNVRDNEALSAALRDGDARVGLAGLPGPVAVARDGASWPADVLADAAALTASYAGKATAAAQRGERVFGRAQTPDGQEIWRGPIEPRRDGGWQEPLWEPAREEIREEQRLRIQAREQARLARREERRKIAAGNDEPATADAGPLQNPSENV